MKSKWAYSAFDGEGARLYGGRWNSKGVSTIYLASSLSLAQLEVLVHVNSGQLLHGYTAFELAIPENLIDAANNFPSNWFDSPPPEETALIGDSWLSDHNSKLALAVPSVITPSEDNYIINMNHPEFQALLDSSQEIDFSFDERLN